MKCIICKGEIEKHRDHKGKVYWSEGHNAEPLASGRCCDKCNAKEVLPIRMADMYCNKIWRETNE